MAKNKQFFKVAKPGEQPSAGEHNKIVRALTRDENATEKHWSKVRLVRLDEVIAEFNHRSPKNRDRAATRRHFDSDTDEFEDNSATPTLGNLHDPFELVYDDDEYLLVVYSEQSSKFYPINGRTVRHAITCRDSSNRYPSRADQPDTYPIRFVKLVYGEAGGRNGHTLEYLSEMLDDEDSTNSEEEEAEDRFVHNIVDPDLYDSFIPEGTLIQVYNVTRQWFTHVCCGAEDSSESVSESSYSSSSESSESSSDSSQSSGSRSSVSSEDSSLSSSDSSQSASLSSSGGSSGSSSRGSSGSSRGSSGSSDDSSGGSSASESDESDSQSSGFCCVTVVKSVEVSFDAEACSLTATVTTCQICFPNVLGVVCCEDV